MFCSMALSCVRHTLRYGSSKVVCLFRRHKESPTELYRTMQSSAQGILVAQRVGHNHERNINSWCSGEEQAAASHRKKGSPKFPHVLPHNIQDFYLGYFECCNNVHQKKKKGNYPDRGNLTNLNLLMVLWSSSSWLGGRLGPGSEALAHIMPTHREEWWRVMSFPIQLASSCLFSTVLQPREWCHLLGVGVSLPPSIWGRQSLPGIPST